MTNHEIMLFCFIIAILLAATLGACGLAILLYFEEQAKVRAETERHGDMKYRRDDCIAPLISAGIAHADALALRRIAMQLHRWHELECGTEHDAVERDETTGKVNWYSPNTGHRSPTRDMETPALKRLGKIMARYPSLQAYVQGDPRGAALYILRPGDVPEGESAGSYYSRGLAVYK